MSAMTPTRSILRGDLSKIGLATLLTLLDMERRGGLLVLQTGRVLGRLFVQDGRVLRAQVEGDRIASAVGGAAGQGRLSGAEAIFELLDWDRGHFELWQAEIQMEDEVRAPTPFLLMEAARLRDERAGAAAVQ